MKSLFVPTKLFVGIAALFLPLAALAFDSPDQALSIIQTSKPIVRTAIGESLPSSGMVRLLISVDDAGKLWDCMPVDYDDQRLADAAIEAIKEWRYEPAQHQGKPVGVRSMIAFHFETNGQVVSMTGCDAVTAYMKNFVNEKQVRLVCRAEELDAAPKPTVVVSPILSRSSVKPGWVDNVLVAALVISPSQTKSAKPAGETKGVWVDFYIDETGHPRMLTVSRNADETMAIAAVEALQQWRFTTPMRKGAPVAVRASQWFDFSKTEVATQ